MKNYNTLGLGQAGRSVVHRPIRFSTKTSRANFAITHSTGRLCRRRPRAASRGPQSVIRRDCSARWYCRLVVR